MPVRNYGIYLCYPPQVDLRAQGLGRQLAAFLLAAEVRTDVAFVIACPSWMRGTLQRLCDDAGVDFQALQILAPAGSPVLLQIHGLLNRIGRRRIGRGWLSNSTAWLRSRHRWPRHAGRGEARRHAQSPRVCYSLSRGRTLSCSGRHCAIVHARHRPSWGTTTSSAANSCCSHFEEY
jgi:hypothetical protein